MSFPCQKIDSCPEIFTGYTSSVNGCNFAISAGPDQIISLGIICSSQGGPPTLCEGGDWPVAPQGLPYNNSGDLSQITQLAGTVTASGPDLIVAHGVGTWFLLNGVAVGDFQASYVLDNLSQFEGGFFLMDGTQQIVYQVYFQIGDSNNSQINLACNGINGDFTQFASGTFGDIGSTPFTLKLIKSGTIIAFYVNNVLILCADTGLTENANLGIYVVEFTTDNPTITNINVIQT